MKNHYLYKWNNIRGCDTSTQKIQIMRIFIDSILYIIYYQLNKIRNY